MTDEIRPSSRLSSRLAVAGRRVPRWKQVASSLLAAACWATPLAAFAAPPATKPAEKQPAAAKAPVPAAAPMPAARPAAETARNPLDDLKHWVDRNTSQREIAERSRDHESIRRAFRDVVKAARDSTVKILADDLNVALGAVVSSDGFVVTKASELRGELKCVFADKRVLPAKLVVVRKEYDLALLQLTSPDPLVPIEWGSTSALVGDFLATAGPSDLPAAIGVVSVVPRKIAAAVGFLGVGLENARPKVIHVEPGSGADKAGLQVDDTVVSVNGEKIESREALQQRIRKFSPGERVDLLVRRGEHEFKATAVLGDPQSVQSDRVDFQNRLGGSLSGRRAGFDSVLQHDTVLHPHECGGPLVDLDGKVIGINIARAGRVATYAIPADVAQSLVERMIAEHERNAAVADRPMNEPMTDKAGG